MSDVKITVSMDSAAAQASAKLLEDELKKLGKGAGEAGKESKSFGQQLTGNLIPAFTAASLAADVIRGGFRAIKNALSETIGAAIEQEDVDSALRASLELTGRTVAGNYEHYKKFAEAQQLVTKFSDEETQAAQNLLLQMTRLDQQGIDRATKGAMGLASVFKMDLQSATVMIQKAMEGNFQALGRYGIRVQETGTLEEKRADLLRQLDGLYGRATAATGTFGGKVALLKNAWGEAQEEIGKAVTQNKAVQALMQTVMETIREFTPEIKEYISGIAGFIGGIANVVKAALEAIDTVRTRVGGMRSEVDDAAAAWDKLNLKLGGFSGVVSSISMQLHRMGKDIPGFGEKLWESFNEIGGRATLAAIAAGKFGVDAQKAFAVVGGETLKLAESLGAVKGKVDEVGKAHEAAAGKMKLVETAIDSINWGKHRAVFEAINKQLYETTTIIEGQLPVVAGYSHAVDEAARHVALLAKEQDKLKKKNPWEELEKSVQHYAETAGAALGSLDAVIQQGTANRMIAIDNEYNRRLAAINASITDEDARQQAIAKLDDEFAAKRKKAAHALGLSTKAIAISNAIISTHEAAAKAMAQGGFILGIPWAAIIEALGWIQVGLIAAQPIPLAKGALFKKPTLLPGPTYEVAEAGAAEIVSPVPMMRKIVREELRGLVPAMAGVFTINGGINIYTPTLARGDVRRAGNEIWDEMEFQARRRGYALSGKG